MVREVSLRLAFFGLFFAVFGVSCVERWYRVDGWTIPSRICRDRVTASLMPPPLLPLPSFPRPSSTSRVSSAKFREHAWERRCFLIVRGNVAQIRTRRVSQVNLKPSQSGLTRSGHFRAGIICGSDSRFYSRNPSRFFSVSFNPSAGNQTVYRSNARYYSISA